MHNNTNQTTATVRNSKNYLADLVNQLLSDGETIKVWFKNTSTRMICTRNTNTIPQDKHIWSKTNDPHMIVVFDLEKGEWRSFTDDSLFAVERHPKHGEP